ncbi:MAG: hypothetical protein J7L38_05460 [Thermoproteales archaeon]|nr:hypothetical protein [Thermoproteales archaeon]RLE62728.1 MAG: hypothetical protein DRJ47_10240 [Thermoprotei archaeon]
MPSNDECIFYKRTAHGVRCILMSPDDWRQRKQKLLDFCNRGGRGCPIMAVYLRVSSNNINRRKITGKSMKEIF